jgi:hypothetical protein
MKPADAPIGTPWGARGHMWADGVHKGVDLLVGGAEGDGRVA